MKSVRLFNILFLICATISTFAIAQSSSEIRSPESVFGFVPGSDRQLMGYGELVDYLLDLSAASDRVEMREVGTSPLGRTMYVAFISAPENLDRLVQLEIDARCRVAVTPETVPRLVTLIRIVVVIGVNEAVEERKGNRAPNIVTSGPCRNVETEQVFGEVVPFVPIARLLVVGFPADT